MQGSGTYWWLEKQQPSRLSSIRLWFLKAPQLARQVYNVPDKFIIVRDFVFWSSCCSIQEKYYINAVQLLYNAQDIQLWLTSTVGYVLAEEHLSLLPVQKTGTFQQQGRSEHVACYRWQDVDGSTHFSPVCWKTNKLQHCSGFYQRREMFSWRMSSEIVTFKLLLRSYWEVVNWFIVTSKYLMCRS